MNREPMFGLDTGFISKQTAGLIRGILQKRYSIGESSIPLFSSPSPLYPGLELISDKGENPIESRLLVGSIRMGYGHHRMALSVYSHSLKKNIPTYLHDLLAITSPESKAIADIDSGYSFFSRMSAEIGGPVEWIWGQLMSQGNLTSLELSCQLAALYKGLMNGIPKDSPVITTYPLNGQIAVASGFNKIIHLICDNYPQYYLLVPGALNLVQSPSSYTKFIEMGVPKDNLAVAGHWVSEDIVSNAVTDSENRVRRIDSKKIRRFLIPIGGAGAQKGYILDLIRLTKSYLTNRKAVYWINTGDHVKVLKAIEEYLIFQKIPYLSIDSWEDLLTFITRHPLRSDDNENNPPVVLFHFPTHTEAFSATDRLIRIADVLVTKPSELAFFPIPKLFIRRVGDHEAASVIRSLELGEGTVECREVMHAKELVQIFTESDDLLLRMNESIIKNTIEGIYNGSKTAVEMATAT
ncbi:hypothetical protein EHQ96_08480 [Leptospira levettii]|uniref:Glycosyl transferase family 28 C-terminal domain-containing protein n=2 Tax=Leptospira levettii TaxID=2023178 RepID=A0ABY2MKM0_9LEPT|nr:hypothetical protein [Leptospira levettii]MCW7495951.1 hypothetical protein [Leptospira levettii]TGL67690.1 hypothetical protein EHQ60_14755 [Leptospira levettii]TGM27666.1 hypothetical protein EHQ71_16795 [Leptospira levettii]TGM30081.1 hypothetical protein EHQ74_00225 [Leptospira levettii]TGM69550.1 hypothetical protein EHQ96_08480 [Leptospira levettii]